MLSNNVRPKVDHVLVVETEENSLSHLFSVLLYFEPQASDNKVTIPTNNQRLETETILRSDY